MQTNCDEYRNFVHSNVVRYAERDYYEEERMYAYWKMIQANDARYQKHWQRRYDKDPKLHENYKKARMAQLQGNWAKRHPPDAKLRNEWIKRRVKQARFKKYWKMIQNDKDRYYEYYKMGMPNPRMARFYYDMRY